MGGVLCRTRGRIRGDVSVAVAMLVAAALVATSLSWSAEAGPTTVMLSTAPDGAPGLGPYHAAAPAVSQDGAHVAFASAAANLVADDGNNAVDVFVRDRGQDGVWRTTVVSARTDGEFGNDDSYSPAISADGSVVAFASEASNLDGGGGDGRPDVFVWHRGNRKVSRISHGLLGGLANGGSYSPSISADGSVVAFASDAANLVVGDLNDLTDVFVWRQNPLTKVVSLVRVITQLLGEPSGGSYQPVVSADGGAVAFASDAPDLVDDDDNGTLDVFVYDRVKAATSLVSRGNDGAVGDGPSFFPALSAQGDRVAFVSMAPSLGSGDGYQPNVYVHDRASGGTELVSKGVSGGPADSSSFSPAISADGRYVAFDSAAGNLVGGDANGAEDVFVHDTYTGATDLVSADGGWFGGDQALYPGISPDGGYVAFAVAPLDMSTTQYYLRGPLLGGGEREGVPVATDPPVEETTTTEAPTEAPTTSTTVAPPTSTTTAVTETTAVTQTTGG
jgi:Tol biopolymer transport system component